MEKTPSKGNPLVRSLVSGADDGIRTRDPHLGKVVLYQLSHVRVPQGYQGAGPGSTPGHRTPVEPNPPSPLVEGGSSVTSTASTSVNGTTRS